MRPAREIPRNPTREPEQQGERRQTVYFPVRGPLLNVAWHAPPTGDPDGPALDALGEILSGGRSSRLYRRLVNDEQVALWAGGAYWELHDAGLFHGSVTVRPDASVERAEALLFEEIERVRREPVAEAELAKARRKLEVRLVNELRTAHALASRLGRDWAAFGRIRPLAELLGGIEAVAVEDVQRVARTYLDPTRRNVVRVVPPPEPAE
jgi:predicted Zn-dependent peptidase